MVNDLIQQGLRRHQAGRLQDAKRLYEQALAIDPRHPDALHLLGLTLLQGGDPASAADLIRKAVAQQPRNWGYQANLAMALFELGQLDEAQAAFSRAAKLNPDEPQLQMGIANCHAMRGNYAEAESQLRKIARRFPRFALAWFNLANAVRDQGRNDEAADLYRRTVQIDPTLVDAHNNLGNMLQALNRLDEGEQAYRRALALKPDSVVGHCNLASVLIDLGRFTEAEDACRKAIALDPRSAMPRSILGAAVSHQGRLQEALELCRQVAALEPENVRNLVSLGANLCELGQTSEGLPILERALSLAPESSEAHFIVAGVKLALGEFDAGWREFIYRPSRARIRDKLRPEAALSSTLPQALAGTRIGLLREQGLGDELFFLRFAGHLKSRGAHVTYRSNPKIASILARVASLDAVLPDNMPIPEADHVLLVSDLPLALSVAESSSFKARVFLRRARPGSVGAWIETIPRALKIAYPELPPPLSLSPLPAQITAIGERLARFGPPPYLGLTWRGGVAPEEQRITWTLFKQIPMESFAEVLRGTTATLLSLQRNPKAGETEELTRKIGKPVHDLSALNEDLEAMLAALALIDDYVGVSNTNMHLRAGAGKTARVLVPCPAEWRWMASGDESPWFPGFRIYRQAPDGDWSAAIENLRHDLITQFGAASQNR